MRWLLIFFPPFVAVLVLGTVVEFTAPVAAGCIFAGLAWGVMMRPKVES